ncbi:MAG: malonate transporter subunit MadM, partial [Bacteroidota bacterium]
MEYITTLLSKNGLIFAFLITGIIIIIADFLSKKLTNHKIPGSAIAIFLGLVVAYIGGIITGGNKGIADIQEFSGFGVMGGAMFRDFAIVSTAMGVSFSVVKKTGLAGIISLFIGVALTFLCG